MIILTIRTDKPEAEIGIYDDYTQLAYHVWAAHRQLAETLHFQIAKYLQFARKDWSEIQGVICFKGPGSFTGLRIGITVGNALAYSLNIPITGTTGEDWIKTGISKLLRGQNEKIVTPHYGSPIHTTQPRK